VQVEEFVSRTDSSQDESTSQGGDVAARLRRVHHAIRLMSDVTWPPPYRACLPRADHPSPITRAPSSRQCASLPRHPLTPRGTPRLGPHHHPSPAVSATPATPYGVRLPACPAATPLVRVNHNYPIAQLSRCTRADQYLQPGGDSPRSSDSPARPAHETHPRLYQ